MLIECELGYLTWAAGSAVFQRASRDACKHAATRRRKIKRGISYGKTSLGKGNNKKKTSIHKRLLFVLHNLTTDLVRPRWSLRPRYFPNAMVRNGREFSQHQSRLVMGTKQPTTVESLGSRTEELRWINSGIIVTFFVHQPNK